MSENQAGGACWALALRTEYFLHTEAVLWIDRAAADRVQRLMEHARYFLSRGQGKMARYAARAAKEIARKEFPSAERRRRQAALEQPCPAVPVMSAAAAGEAYDNIYLAHFGADRREVA